jgi:hypothetical protein
MQYKIPQNIEVEDKVVGPLTLRQFLILLIAAAIVFVLFLMTPAEIKGVFYMFAVVIVAIALGIAFFDYGGKHLEQIIFAAFLSFTSPRKRIWKKEPPAEAPASKENAEKEIAEIPIVAQKQDVLAVKENFAQMARSIDTTSKDSDLNDVLEKPTGKNPLGELIAKAKPQKTKNPTVAQLATVSPNKKFEYPQIQVSSQNPLENLKQK